MKIVVMAIAILTVAMAPLTNNNQANAICLWNCDVQEVTEKGPDFLDCLRFQIIMKDYDKKKYGTDDLSEGGKLISSKAEPGEMITADQLKKEWKEHPELYEGDCHKTWNLTPQLLGKFEQEVVIK